MGLKMEIWEIYQWIKKKAGIEKVDPQNIQKIREVLSNITLDEIAKVFEIKRPRVLEYINFFLIRFLTDPMPRQKLVLYTLSKRNPPTSLSSISRELGFGTLYSSQALVPLKILEDMGLVRSKTILRNNRRFSIIEICHQKFKEYWPDIEEWKSIKTKKEKMIKGRASKGEQMKRAFSIIAKETKGDFGPKVVKTIKSLTRGDFHERGWEIDARSLGKLKKRLLKMPLEKFVKKLKEAQEAFLFSKFLLKC
jgi:DNA-binding MarR family transcriptional regulator